MCVGSTFPSSEFLTGVKHRPFDLHGSIKRQRRFRGVVCLDRKTAGTVFEVANILLRTFWVEGNVLKFSAVTYFSLLPAKNSIKSTLIHSLMLYAHGLLSDSLEFEICFISISQLPFWDLIHTP